MQNDPRLFILIISFAAPAAEPAAEAPMIEGPGEMVEGPSQMMEGPGETMERPGAMMSGTP